MKKALVAYFSASGTTAKLAAAVAAAAEGELFEIRPLVPYSAADLKWTNPLSRCNREKIGKKTIPLASSVENWADFDTVFLGFPIWYYGAPNVIESFAKSYDWSGKTVVLFATSGGSNIGKTAEKSGYRLEDFPDNAAVFRQPCLNFRGNFTDLQSQGLDHRTETAEIDLDRS